MAEKLKVVLNSDGVRELLRSAELRKACAEQAEQIRARCGEGYEAMTHIAPTRVYATVTATTPKARNSNLKNNTILKALK